MKKAFDETIEMANTYEPDDVYYCCERMADLFNGLNFSPAAIWLGYFCETVMLDYEAAKYWYDKAIANGHGLGYYRLGILYITDKLPPIDRQSIISYFEEALCRGVPEAKQVLQDWFNKEA